MKKIIYIFIFITLSNTKIFTQYSVCMTVSPTSNSTSGTVNITFTNTSGATKRLIDFNVNLSASPNVTFVDDPDDNVGVNGSTWGIAPDANIVNNGTSSFSVAYSGASIGNTTFTMSSAAITITSSGAPITTPTPTVPNSCSSVTISITLPLDLLSFQAQTTSKNNLLKWQTANEVNTQSFDIERSANGKNFEKVGNVKSVGTAKGAYQFTDEVPLSGINYYRLKMMDIDGSFTYSPVRSVVLGEGKATNVSIAPNPAKGQVFVKLNADEAKAITLVLVDVTGKTVLTERKNLESGFNQLPLNVSNYPQGLYFLKIVDANTTETHRLVIGN